MSSIAIDKMRCIECVIKYIFVKVVKYLSCYTYCQYILWVDIKKCVSLSWKTHYDVVVSSNSYQRTTTLVALLPTFTM